MIDKIAVLVKNHPEKWVSKIIGRVFWPPPSIAVLAFGENDDVLTLRLDGRHQLPGGIMDLGEDLRESARREVKEETGFDADIRDILDIRVHDKGGFTIFFEAEVVGGEKQGSWEGEPEFVPREKIKEKVWRLEHSHIHEYLFPEQG